MKKVTISLVLLSALSPCQLYAGTGGADDSLGLLLLLLAFLSLVAGVMHAADLIKAYPGKLKGLIHDLLHRVGIFICRIICHPETRQ